MEDTEILGLMVAKAMGREVAEVIAEGAMGVVQAEGEEVVSSQVVVMVGTVIMGTTTGDTKAHTTIIIIGIA